MAEKKDKGNGTLTPVEANDALNDLAVSGTAPVTFDEAFDIMENAKDEQLQSLAADYFTFEKVGQENSFIVDGFDIITLQGKPVEVVKMRQRDGSSIIAGDKVLVSACKKLSQLPAYIRVKYLADIKNAQGTYKNLSVKTFPLPNKS